ncbi:MAG: polysaccharide deacetylase family protein [Burkholderiales bacterium]|nr:polysaccharide deacetylase family protein [Burkholderiales bacterium]
MMRLLLSGLSPAGPLGRLTTLIFHRVLTEPDPIFPDEIDALRFDEICGWLASWFNVLPLDQAIVRLREGRLPSRALAITFDDGYADNHDVALPILRRHRLCATCFVATGFLDGGRMWNDTVIESIRTARGTTLDLRGIPGASLDVYPLAAAQQRRQAIESVIARVKYMPMELRLATVTDIERRSGGNLPDDLMMKSVQVRAMSDAGMQIGAHTENHPILASLDELAIRGEMLRSKRRLEEIVGRHVTLFAYPNGKPHRDYGAAAVRIARELGFIGAVSTARGVATQSTDPYQIPRFTPWDRRRLRFGMRLVQGMRTTCPEQVLA